MKRCVAELADGYSNIPADRLELDREAGMIYVYDDNNLAAAFDVSIIMKIYISEKKEDV